MSDLDKLMEKMNKSKPKEKENIDNPPKEEIEEKEEEKDKAIEEIEEIDDEDDEDQEENDPVNPIPANVDDKHSIESEVGILQNDGIFRRELILTLKELIVVHKINTQFLGDLKKIVGGEDGKKD